MCPDKIGTGWSKIQGLSLEAKAGGADLRHDAKVVAGYKTFLKSRLLRLVLSQFLQCRLVWQSAFFWGVSDDLLRNRQFYNFQALPWELWILRVVAPFSRYSHIRHEVRQWWTRRFGHFKTSGVLHIPCRTGEWCLAKAVHLECSEETRLAGHIIGIHLVFFNVFLTFGTHEHIHKKVMTHNWRKADPYRSFFSFNFFSILAFAIRSIELYIALAVAVVTSRWPAVFQVHKMTMSIRSTLWRLTLLADWALKLWCLFWLVIYNTIGNYTNWFIGDYCNVSHRKIGTGSERRHSVYHNCPWFHSESVDHDTHSKKESVVILHLHVQRVLAKFIHIWDEYNYHQNIKRIHPYLSHSPYSENTIRIDCTILSLAPASSSTHSDFVSRFQSNHGDENHLVVQAVRQQGSRWVEKLKSWVSLSEDLIHLESFIIIYIHIRSIITRLLLRFWRASCGHSCPKKFLDQPISASGEFHQNKGQSTLNRNMRNKCTTWDETMWLRSADVLPNTALLVRDCRWAAGLSSNFKRRSLLTTLGTWLFWIQVPGFLKQMQTQVVLWRVAQCNAQIGCICENTGICIHMYTPLYIGIPSNAYLNGANDDKPW